MTHPRPHRPSRAAAARPGRRGARRAGGFSLIEVLVSMFIVSLGILALAGLLQSATRFGKMSEMRSTATLLANDIADHMRANYAGVTSAPPAYNVTDKFPAAAPVDRRTTPGDQCRDIAAGCPASEIAAVDLFFWTQRLLATLPQGTPYIRYNAPTGTRNGSADIWVAWQDPGTSPTGQTDRPATECPPGLQVQSQPSVRCVYLQVGLATQ